MISAIVRSAIRVTVLGVATIAGTGVTLAQAATPAAGQATESQKAARMLLDGMAKYLAGLPGFQATLVSSYDAPQASGQMIEFNAVRTLGVARPDRLRIDVTYSDGSTDLIVFDGKTMTVYDQDDNVFSRAPQPGSLDDAIAYFVRDLGMTLPLGAMLTTRFEEELNKRVVSVDYVEGTSIFGIPAHHIAGRTRTVDFQVWIADGDQPRPLRIVLAYVKEPGQPQFRVQILDWKGAPPAGADVFRLSLPADARQIAFAVQVKGMVSGAAAPAQEAGP